MVERQRLTSGEPSPESTFEESWKSETSNFVDSKSENINTRLAYERDLKQFKAYLDREQVDGWRRINRQTVREFFNSLHMELSPASRLRKASVIRPFLLRMIKQGYPIPRDSWKAVPSVGRAEILEFRPENQPPLSEEDFGDLVNRAGSRRNRALLYLLRSGLGPAHITSLRMQNVQGNIYDKGNPISIEVGNKDKYGRPLLFKLDDAASNTLREYFIERKDDDANDPSSPLIKSIHRGQLTEPITRQGIWVVVNNIGGKCRINCSPKRLNQMASPLR